MAFYCVVGDFLVAMATDSKVYCVIFDSKHFWNDKSYFDVRTLSPLLNFVFFYTLVEVCFEEWTKIRNF